MKRIIFIGGVLLALAGCDYYDAYMRTKQIRTYIDLQSICRLIDAGLARKGQALTRLETTQIVQSVNQGRDAWGTEVIFISRVKGGNKMSYVLVSLGSDRKADVANLEIYFSSPERVIRDESWRDLVFRDGKPVTKAGK